jgi:hypothetical protein
MWEALAKAVGEAKMAEAAQFKALSNAPTSEES